MIPPAILTVRHSGPNRMTLHYTLHCEESSTSQLASETGVGTVLDRSLPRKFEYTIYERDTTGYCGHCASFPADSPEALQTAIHQLLALADVTHENLIAIASPCHDS